MFDSPQQWLCLVEVNKMRYSAPLWLPQKGRNDILVLVKIDVNRKL